MYGRPRWDERAQLALMDAMVFFAVSAVICGTLMSHVASQFQYVEDEAFSPSETDELLTAFLGASMGRTFTLDGLGTELTGLERFAEVLFLVSAMILDGQDADLFAEVLSHCGRVISALCEPWSSTLRLSSSEYGSWRILVEVGEPPPADSDTCAASQSLGASDGTGLVVTLVLFPTLSLHGLGV